MKKAIIVGASSGIGREVACRLIRDGWQVGLMARREQPLVSLREMADDRVDYALCDVTMPDAPDRLLALIDRLGGVDLYFHAAGIGSQNLDLESQIEMNTVNTNAVGFCRLVNVAFQYMKTHGGGHIAVISSIAGVKGLAPAPSYSATKAFQNTYIQALEQLAYSQRLPIRFTDIRPGFVDTALIAGSGFTPAIEEITAICPSSAAFTVGAMWWLSIGVIAFWCSFGALCPIAFGGIFRLGIVIRVWARSVISMKIKNNKII